MCKATLRQDIRTRRNALPLEIRAEKDRLIFQNIVQWDVFQTCNALLLYNSFGMEIDTKSLFYEARKRKIPVYLPRTNSKEKIMRFFLTESLENLEKRGFGIYEPTGTTPELLQTEGSLCLVPGLCLDAAGFRLGYGGGYYDKYLLQYQGITAALVYDDFVLKSLPIEPFDVAVQYLATETTLRPV